MTLYLPNKPNMDQYVNLRLSPVSNFILELVTDAILDKKNIIVEFPSKFSNFSLLVANNYSYATKKSTLLFTKKENIFEYNDTYYRMLSDNYVPYRSLIPIGIKTDNGIKLREKFLKNIHSSIRSKYVDAYQKDLINHDKPIIILISENDFIKNIDGTNIDISKSNGKGLAIFDNVSTKNIQKIEKIIDWCDHEKINYIFFTNFATPNFYELIKSKNEVLFIPFHNGLFDFGNELNASFIQYYAENHHVMNMDSINKFNIDQESTYDNKMDVEVEVIQNGKGLIPLLKSISQAISELGDVELALRREIHTLSKSAYEAVDSFVTPDHLTKYSVYSNRRINGIGFCDNIHIMSQECDDMTKHLCEIIIGSFWSIRNIIEKCKSPIAENGYQKENKFSRLFTIINDYSESNENLYVATPNENEVKYLSTLLKEYFPQMTNRLFISSLNTFDEKKTYSGILILSGKPEYNQMFVLDMQFQRKIVLAYMEDDEHIIKNLIEMYKTVTDCRKQLLLESLNLIRTKMKNSSKYFEKYDFLFKLEYYLKIVVPDSSNGTQYYLDSLKKDMHEKFQAYSDFSNSKKKVDNFSDKVYKDLDLSYERSIRDSHKYYELVLESIYYEETIQMISGLESNHTIINDKGELEEKPYDLKSEGLIVIEVPGKRTSLLNMLIEIYELDECIDKTVVELWEDCLKSYERTSSHSLSDFYEAYCKHGGKREKQTVRLWLNRTFLGPQNLEDILIIGKVLSIDELCTEGEYIFRELEKIRALKRSLGRRLSKIIAMELSGDDLVDGDPFSDTIWKNLKSYLYRIKSIRLIQ